MRNLLPLLLLLVPAFAFGDPPPPLREVLFAMPKGGDLHHHLSGSVYAETFLELADRDRLCLDKQQVAIVECPPAAVEHIVSAGTVFTDPELYSAALDAMSMRQFRPIAESGHDHFFNAFRRFRVVARRHVPEMLTEVVSRFAAENVDYLETIFSPDRDGWRTLVPLISGTTFPEMYDSFMKSAENVARLGQIVADARKNLDDAEWYMRSTLRCGTPEARPGCDSTVRYIYEVYRGRGREAFLSGLMVGFTLANSDPRVVALNPVMPEDSYLSMRQFDEQMKMLAFFRARHPNVHLTTHAGELTLGLVPVEGLRYHIRDSIFVAGAERIGHGVGITYERDASALMKTMTTRGIAVEVCLTSSDIILGVRGRDHPLHLYLQHGVPVVLATDDPGVARDDMTHQYVRAVREHGLSYAQLKQIARNSLEYAFVEGASFWADRRYERRNPACTIAESVRCSDFLAKNTKARLQSRLEEQFRDFERRYGTELPAEDPCDVVRHTSSRPSGP